MSAKFVQKNLCPKHMYCLGQRPCMITQGQLEVNLCKTALWLPCICLRGIILLISFLWKRFPMIQLFCDCIYFFFLLSHLQMTFFFFFLLNFICNYWVPLATRHSFIMASTSLMYFYNIFCILFTYHIYIYCEMKTNKLELELEYHFGATQVF